MRGDATSSKGKKTYIDGGSIIIFWIYQIEDKSQTIEPNFMQYKHGLRQNFDKLFFSN